MLRGILANAAVAVALAGALATVGRAQTNDSAQKSSPVHSTASKPAKVAVAHAFGVMSQAAGCTVLNKGEHGQICYYDVTRLRPERTAQRGPDVPIYISIRNHDAIVWHSGGATPVSRNWDYPEARPQFAVSAAGLRERLQGQRRRALA